jgi:hypothetical protein
MARPKSERHSADVAREIKRLEEERKHLIDSEDRRRGAVIRELLGGDNADELRAVLSPVVTSRDGFLFGIEKPISRAKESRDRSTSSDIPSGSSRRVTASATA